MRSREPILEAPRATISPRAAVSSGPWPPFIAMITPVTSVWSVSTIALAASVAAPPAGARRCPEPSGRRWSRGRARRRRVSQPPPGACSKNRARFSAARPPFAGSMLRVPPVPRCAESAMPFRKSAHASAEAESVSRAAVRKYIEDIQRHWRSRASVAGDTPLRVEVSIDWWAGSALARRARPHRVAARRV